MAKKIRKVIVVAGIIVNQNGQVLIIQRNPSERSYPKKWELPSGKVEPDETIAQAFERELFEETSLRIKLFHPESPTSEFQYTISDKTETRITTQKNYAIELKEPQKVIISKEHTNFAWANQKELSKYDIIQGLDKVITKGYHWLNKKDKNAHHKDTLLKN